MDNVNLLFAALDEAESVAFFIANLPRNESDELHQKAVELEFSIRKMLEKHFTNDDAMIDAYVHFIGERGTKKTREAIHNVQPE